MFYLATRLSPDAEDSPTGRRALPSASTWDGGFRRTEDRRYPPGKCSVNYNQQGLHTLLLRSLSSSLRKDLSPRMTQDAKQARVGPSSL